MVLSYARADGRILAGTLRTELERLAVPFWQDVIDMHAGEAWWRQIEEQIDGARCLVLAVTPAALRSEVVTREWVYARRRGTPVLPVVGDSKTLREAPRWLAATDVLLLEDGHPDLEQTRLRLRAQVLTPPPRQPVPFMPEELPPQHVSRSAEKERLVRQLVARTGDPRLTDVVLHGPAGFGKSTLALEVCHDGSVVNAFTGGILWATLGENGQGVLPGLNRMLSALARQPITYASVEEGVRRLADLLAHRDCLIVIDDVWDLGHLRPFLAARCARLVTTRRPEELSLPGSTLEALAEMTSAEATEVLARYVSPAPSSTQAPDERGGLSRLARRLGEWPLLLQIFGGALRAEVGRGAPVSDALERISAELVEAGLTAFDRGTDRSRALAASMEVSLRLFSEGERERLYELSIFREDDSVDERAVFRLWGATGGLSEIAARRLLREWGGMFFSYTYDRALKTHLLRFHDALREYLGSRLTSARQQGVHATLLDSYRAAGPWSEVPDDGYLYDHLAYHLVGAGRERDLHSLFDDPRWMKARFQRSGFTYDGFMQDLTYAADVAARGAHRGIDDGRNGWYVILCARYRVIASTVTSLADAQPPALVRRAVELGLWPEMRAARLIARIADMRRRLRGLAHLLALPGLSDPGRREVEEMVSASLDEYGQGSGARPGEEIDAHLLIELVAVMRGPRKSEVLTRAQELAVSVPLRAQARSEANRAIGINDFASLSRSTTHALAAVARHLRGEVRDLAIEQGLAHVDRFDDPKEKVHALAAWLPLLPPERRPEILGQARSATALIANQQERLFALAALAKGLEPPAAEAIASEVWDEAAAIADEPWRAYCVSRSAIHLSGSRREQAVALAARTLAGERGWALTQGLLPDLQPEERRRLEGAVNSLTADKAQAAKRAELEMALEDSEVEWIESELREELDSPWAVDRLMATVARHASPELVRRTLDFLSKASLNERGLIDRLRLIPVRRIRGRPINKPWQKASGPLHRADPGPPMSPEGLAAELRRIEGIAGDPHWKRDRAQLDGVLRILPQLTPPLVEMARKIIRGLSSGWERADGLLALAWSLSERPRQEALEEALDNLVPATSTHNDYNAAVLESLIVIGGLEVQARALELLRTFDEWSRIRALKPMIACASGATLDRALGEVAALTNDSSRGEVLACLPALTGETAPRVLAIVDGMADGPDRTDLLQTLVSGAPASLLPALLDRAATIARADGRARVRAAVMDAHPPGDALLRQIRHDLVEHLQSGDLPQRREVLVFLVDRSLWADPIIPLPLLNEVGRWAASVCRDWSWE